MGNLLAVIAIILGLFIVLSAVISTWARNPISNRSSTRLGSRGFGYDLTSKRDIPTNGPSEDDLNNMIK